jgi:ribosome-associated translation inhibitor RaiA
VIEDLQASTAAAAAMDARLRATMQQAERAQHSEVGRRPNRSSSPGAASAPLSPPTASNIETASRASSVSEAISERLKDYLDERLEQFQQDMRRIHESIAEYSTMEDMEIHVERKVAESTAGLVEDWELEQAIEQAVDKVFERIRDKASEL